jgi:hypothetical protein
MQLLDIYSYLFIILFGSNVILFGIDYAVLAK